MHLQSLFDVKAAQKEKKIIIASELLQSAAILSTYNTVLKNKYDISVPEILLQ